MNTTYHETLPDDHGYIEVIKSKSGNQSLPIIRAQDFLFYVLKQFAEFNMVFLKTRDLYDLPAAHGIASVSPVLFLSIYQAGGLPFTVEPLRITSRALPIQLDFWILCKGQEDNEEKDVVLLIEYRHLILWLQGHSVVPEYISNAKEKWDNAHAQLKQVTHRHCRAASRWDRQPRDVFKVALLSTCIFQPTERRDKAVIPISRLDSAKQARDIAKNLGKAPNWIGTWALHEELQENMQSAGWVLGVERDTPGFVPAVHFFSRIMKRVQ